jgi:chemotaxis signal transduction protein
MEQQELLFFDVGETRCAIPIESAERVIEAVELTTYPEMPVDLEGMMNISEELLPVMNLRVLLAKPEKALAPEHFFVLFDSVSGRAAIRAESMPYSDKAAVNENIVFDKLGNKPEQIANLLGQGDQTILVLEPNGLYPQAAADYVRGIIESTQA